LSSTIRIWRSAEPQPLAAGPRETQTLGGLYEAGNIAARRFGKSHASLRIRKDVAPDYRMDRLRRLVVASPSMVLACHYAPRLIRPLAIICGAARASLSG
jgi:hypothetical protein